MAYGFAVLFYYQYKRYSEEADEMWEAASDDVRSTYGKRYLDAMLAKQRTSTAGGGLTTGPVIDALEDAIMSGRPETRYIVDGGFFDIYTVSYFKVYVNFFFLSQKILTWFD